MHGRARLPKGFEPTAEQREKLRKKTELLKNATSEVLSRVEKRQYDAKTLAASAKLLALNPEIYTVWNYRKDAMTQFLGKADEEAKWTLCAEELRIVAAALRSNPKSYGAWHHRRWIVERGFCQIQAEWEFVEAKLKEDCRNFHAWNYRQFLVRKTERAPEVELQFSQAKIEQNFSNYSAWHHRSRCLERMHQTPPPVALTDLAEGVSGDRSTGQVSLATLEAELPTVHSAFVTDPDDSSAWIYYRWLMHHFDRLPREEAAERALRCEVEFFQTELVPLDPEGKWVLLTYALLLEVAAKRGVAGDTRSAEIYEKLGKVDPMRAGFYRDVEAGHASILTSP